MKICLLTLANPYSWTPHFVRAFRARAEVLTVGPAFDEPFFITLGIPFRPDLAGHNDIDAELHPGVNLASLLPAGWTPDLIVAISDFGRALCPDMAAYDCPKAYLSIDTWQTVRDYLDAMHFDFAFAAQREFVEALAASGARHASWLPLGCSPEVHHRVDVAEDCDISFAGAVVSGVHDERARLLGALGRQFRVECAQRVYGEDLCAACCRGRLTFNHAAVGDLNMRVFEALAMGRPLLTNRDAARNGLLDLFEDGKHLLVYDNEAHLVALTERYLADSGAREAVAEAGRTEVLARHTYAHRVETLLARIEAHVPGFPRGRTVTEAPQTLTELVHPGAGLVVDLGNTCGAARPALETRGMTHFAGVEDVSRDPGATASEADTVLVGDFQRFPQPPEELMRQAHRLLRPGGEALFQFSATEMLNLGVAMEVQALEAWLRRLDFHLLTLSILAPGAAARRQQAIVIRARKRTRTIGDLVDEGLRRAGVDLPDVREFLGHLPPDA